MVTEIVIGVAVAVSAIVSLLLCVCGKARNARSPNSNHRLDHAEDNNNDKREEEVAVRTRTDQNSRRDFEPDKTGSVRPKTLTINRKLPEIPHSAAAAAAAAELITTDLYSTVDEATAPNKTPTLTSSALNSPVPSPSSLQAIYQNGPLSAETPSKRNRPSSILSDRPTQIFEQRHNYAKIKGQTSDDRDTDTYCDPQVYADSSAAANGAIRNFEPAMLYEPPPPVPEKYFELCGADQAAAGTNSSTQSSSLSSSAASAIAGNPSIPDIPFMTSPVPSNQNLNFVEDSDTYTRSDNVFQEIRYTSISVREPLANIRAQMVIRPAPTVPVPTSASVAAAAAAPVIVESHYSIVPEEIDQTYAEIESAQHSATSSMTYSRIDADGERMISMPNVGGAHYPPAPPTVESLRTVAQAHSRHASSSSCISDSNSHHNSPATDRSFDLNESGCDQGRSSASPDFSAIYSVVDKSKKVRSTVHVMESKDVGGGSAHPSVSSIEDMYAKVTKKRPHPLTHVEAAAGARPKRPNTIDVNHVMPHEISAITGSGGVLRRQSSGRVDFGYEKIREVTKEPQTPDAVFEGVELRKKFVLRNDVHSDPNYEVVMSDDPATSYPNYETIKEPASSRYTFVNSFDEDLESENGYEKVKNPGGGAFCRSDPNYESVRYGANVRDEIGGHVENEGAATADAAAQESAAEAASRWSDALYEKINGREDDDQSDPNYENVKTVSESSNETSEFGYERLPPKRKLFEVEDGYERIRDRRVVAAGGGVPLISRKPAAEPGYESIKDRVNSVSSLDNDDIVDELYAIPTTVSHVTPAAELRLHNNSSAAADKERRPHSDL